MLPRGYMGLVGGMGGELHTLLEGEEGKGESNSCDEVLCSQALPLSLILLSALLPRSFCVGAQGQGSGLGPSSQDRRESEPST